MLARLRALDILKKEVGVHEEGSNNLGKRVREYQRADTLPGEGYAWCQSLQNWAWVKATGKLLANGTASVGFFVAHARARGWIVSRPFRGDHVAFHFNSDSWPDHVGMIEKVLGLGRWMYLQTIEGNTGPFGAVSDPGTGRDGVYRKRRFVRRDKVIFVRVPGRVPDPKRRPRRK